MAKSARYFLTFGIVLVLLVGCQQQPTKIYRSGQPSDVEWTKSLNRPIELNAETILVDARPRLATGLTKVPRAIPVHWDDFTRRFKSSRGPLEADLDGIAKRLALKGIAPNHPVVVLGEGPKGDGEEGRLAWMLMYLGFPDVQTSTIAALTLRVTTDEEPPIENLKPWKLATRDSLMADSKEVMIHALGKKPQFLHLIDVRSPKEYFARDKKTETYLDPDLRAINIEWKEFFTAEGRPNPEIRAQLEAVGLKANDRIVIISSEGVRSGAVTYAMTMIGFKNVGNYAAGWKSLK